MSHSYQKLKEMAKQMDNNYLNYLTNKAHFFYLNDEKDEAEK